MSAYNLRLFELAFAFISFRDALSLPFLYLLLHYSFNVAGDGRECPFGSPAFGFFVALQLLFVGAKRIQAFYMGMRTRLWWQLEIAYALYMYPWGTAMFILAKPTYFSGAVNGGEECDLYHHPMAQLMWIVAEITCSGAGLGLLLLGLAWATLPDPCPQRVARVAGVVAAQILVAVLWNVLIVQAVAPWATRLL